MSEKVLPIEQAPFQAEKLSSVLLHTLNESLLTAQLRAAEVRELRLRLMVAERAARDAADTFALRRDWVSEKAGVKIGETHGWDMETGELRPLEVRKA